MGRKGTANSGLGTWDSHGRILVSPKLSFVRLWRVSTVRKGWGEERKSVRITHRRLNSQLSSCFLRTSILQAKLHGRHGA